PLLGGRSFERQDRQDTTGVAIISETFARRFFPDEEPIGQVLQAVFRRDTGQSMDDRSRRIVGVVGDIRHRIRSEPEPAIYVPYRQNLRAYPFVPLTHTAKNVVIRTVTDPMGLAAALRHTVAEIDKDQVPISIMTLDELLSEEVGQERFWMRLFGLFAALAVFLAAVGLYGVVSYSVARRTREFGLRMALGAEQANVLKLVGREVLVLSLSGVAVGVVAALALTPLMASQLFGVGTADPATFVVVSLVLIAVALLSCYLPARRATKVDPMTALRHE
ncbi:MAG: FtsX-like permease family protein, partial [bacterium]|nr:FtsX-like permease family protein [bacterium]